MELASCLRPSTGRLSIACPMRRFPAIKARIHGRQHVKQSHLHAFDCCHSAYPEDCDEDCSIFSNEATETSPSSRGQEDLEGFSALPLWMLSAATAAVMLAACWPALADSLLSIPGLVGDDPFREGAVSGFLLIFFSEIGDKTFFIALLLALKQNRTSVFAGTFGALGVMTVISVGLGQALHEIDNLLPAGTRQSIPYDDVLAAALLVFFGVKTLQDAKDATTSAQEEREEAQEEVDKFSAGGDLALILSTFVLVFAAEWGDKSFLATIALSAASSPTGVVTGAVAGHGVATALAVAGGSVLSKYIDERVLQYVGGSLFLVYAGATVFDIFVQHPDLISNASGGAM